MGHTKRLIGARGRAAAVLLGLLAAGCGAGDRTAAPVFVALTTTIEDSGLLDTLVASFRAARPDLALRTVTGGTGEVLALGRRGDVDLVISHDPAAESAFVAEGHGVARYDVFRSEFVIAGPPADPADIAGERDPVAALRSIAALRARFVSRADDSGTHRKERALWAEAGLDPAAAGAGGWYVEAGTGMGDALRLASARGAYILTDRPTLLMLGPGLELTILVAGDARLVNPYGAVPVRDARHAAGAAAFVAWLRSERGRAVIEAYGRDRFGRPLFSSTADEP